MLRLRIDSDCYNKITLFWETGCYTFVHHQYNIIHLNMVNASLKSMTSRSGYERALAEISIQLRACNTNLFI